MSTRTMTSALTAAEEPTVPRMGHARAVVAMTRPAQIALIVLVLAGGVLLGIWRSGGVLVAEPASLAIANVLVVLAAAAVHLANEAADHETDRLTVRTHFSGGSGALAASGLDPSEPRRLGLMLALVVTMGAVLALTTAALPTVAVVLLVAGVAGGLAYSLPPVSAVRRGWGEPLNALLGGMLLPLFGVAVASGTLEWLDTVAFAPFTAVVFASVMATAWPDHHADAATGKATMQVRLRTRQLRRIHVTASVAFVVLTVLSAGMGAMPLAAAGLVVTPALAVGAVRYTRARSPLPNVAAMVGTAAVTAIALIVVIGLELAS